MSPLGLTTALTLYRSGTITLPQAAHRAGLSETDLAAALRRRGIDISEEESYAAERTRSARAD